VSDVIALFDKMMEVFIDIGRILPQFQKYRELLDKDQIQPVLTLFYKEILAMYSVLFEFLKHPGMGLYFRAKYCLSYLMRRRQRSELIHRCCVASFPRQDRRHPGPYQGP